MIFKWLFQTSHNVLYSTTTDRYHNPWTDSIPEWALQYGKAYLCIHRLQDELVMANIGCIYVEYVNLWSTYVEQSTLYMSIEYIGRVPTYIQQATLSTSACTVQSTGCVYQYVYRIYFDIYTQSVKRCEVPNYPVPLSNPARGRIIGLPLCCATARDSLGTSCTPYSRIILV